MRKVTLGAVVSAVALNFAMLPAQAGSLKKVNVGDDYYGPTKVTVKKGTTIDWVWVDTNVNTHNVKLKSAPHGVKKFTSASAASQFTYKKKLTVPGTYKIICTLHRTMTMTIVVKK